MSKEHFEPVTAKSVAERLYHIAAHQSTHASSKYETISYMERILEPHIRKPSDGQMADVGWVTGGMKSVPQRCEDAYNEAKRLIAEAASLLTTNKSDAAKKWYNERYHLVCGPNPFKEAEIVPDDVDVFMDLLEDEKQKWPEPNLPSDVEQFKKRLQDIMYFKKTDSDYTHTGKINSLFNDLISAVEFYKTHNVAEELKPEPQLLPFDLKAAQEGAKVVTRDGTPVKIVSDNIDSEYPILYIANKKNGKQFYNRTDIKGTDKEGTATNSLFILKEPETVALRLYKDRNDGSIQAVNVQHDSMTKYYDADCDLIKTITVTI